MDQAAPDAGAGRVTDVPLQVVTAALASPAKQRSRGETDALFAVLQQAAPLDGWRAWAVRELCGHAERRSLATGADLYGGGGAATGWWMLLAGAVESRRMGQSHVCLPGECLGMVRGAAGGSRASHAQ